MKLKRVEPFKSGLLPFAYESKVGGRMKIGILDGVITRGSPIEFLLSTAAVATELAVEAEFVVVVVLPLLVLLYSFEMIIFFSLPSIFVYQTTRNVFYMSRFVLFLYYIFNCCNYETLRKEIIIIMTMFVYYIYHVLVLLLWWWNYYWLIDCRSFFFIWWISGFIVLVTSSSSLSFRICRHPIIVILTTIISIYYIITSLIAVKN